MWQGSIGSFDVLTHHKTCEDIEYTINDTINLRGEAEIKKSCKKGRDRGEKWREP